MGHYICSPSHSTGFVHRACKKSSLSDLIGYLIDVFGHHACKNLVATAVLVNNSFTARNFVP